MTLRRYSFCDLKDRRVHIVTVDIDDVCDCSCGCSSHSGACNGPGCFHCDASRTEKESSMTLQYRAVLQDADASRMRPLQIFASSMAEVDEWAARLLPGAMEGASVVVYQMTETKFKVIEKQ